MKKFISLFLLLFFVSVQSSFAWTASNVSLSGNALSFTASGLTTVECPTNFYEVAITSAIGSTEYALVNANVYSPYTNFNYVGLSFPNSWNNAIDYNIRLACSGGYGYHYSQDFPYSLLFPATPTPTPTSGSLIPVANTDVVDNTQGLVLGVQTAFTENLSYLLPIGAVVLISIAVVFWVLNHFKKLNPSIASKIGKTKGFYYHTKHHVTVYKKNGFFFHGSKPHTTNYRKGGFNYHGSKPRTTVYKSGGFFYHGNKPR